MEIRPARGRAALAAVILFAASYPCAVSAQESSSTKLSGTSAPHVESPLHGINVSMRDWRFMKPNERLQLGPVGRSRFQQPARASQTPPRRKHSSAQRVLTAVALGFTGFWAGAAIGGAVQGDCGCDDPGSRAPLVGATAGAVTGVIAGLVLTR
jgi:hypothetical protein